MAGRLGGSGGAGPESVRDDMADRWIVVSGCYRAVSLGGHDDMYCGSWAVALLQMRQSKQTDCGSGARWPRMHSLAHLISFVMTHIRACSSNFVR